jgi:hypothetical protein
VLVHSFAKPLVLLVKVLIVQTIPMNVTILEMAALILPLINVLQLVFLIVAALPVMKLKHLTNVELLAPMVSIPLIAKAIHLYVTLIVVMNVQVLN